MAIAPTPSAAPVQTLDAEREQQILAGRSADSDRLGRRALIVEGMLLASFLGLSIVLALRAPHVDLVLAAAMTAVYALSLRVGFEVGVGITYPSQLVVVPMLLVLPPGVVPACVGLAMLADRTPGLLKGERLRWALAPNNALYVIGPALLLATAGLTPATFALAIALQILGDLGWSTLRAWGDGSRLSAHLRELDLVWLVDLMLTPVGVAAGLAGRWGFLVAVPLGGLLHWFSKERSRFIGQALVLSETYRRIALLLGDVIGDDDEYTGDHSQGVVALAVEVAVEMGLDERGRQLTELGALLHDVGKIQVPNDIINKPGPLDDEEWAVMRTHTVLGQEMLDRVGGWLTDVGIIVRASHERWDGGGYPDGLAAQDIPLPSRIVSCCDAFSAMTTTRSYRPARPIADALEELRRCAGTHFDPDVVAATCAAVLRRERAAAVSVLAA